MPKNTQNGPSGSSACPERLTITVPEAATKLGISRASAYEGVRSGSLPSVRVGKRYLIPLKRFERFLEG